MIQQYETTFILDAHLPEEQIEKAIERITKLIETYGGKVKHVDRWGKRRLAYEINRKQYGYYVYFRFEAEGDSIIKLERECKLDEVILRFLTILVSKIALKQEEKKKSDALKLEDEKKNEKDDAKETHDLDKPKENHEDHRIDSEELPPSEVDEKE